MASNVFADRVQVTVDRMDYRAVRLQVLPILDSLGATPLYDRPASEEGLWQLPDRGTFKVTPYGRVAALGASGRVLGALRAAAMLGEFLHALGTVPHKVTLLDATMDVAADAPPIVHAAYDRAARGEGYQLSRKRVPSSAVGKYFGQRLDGRESGTVWIGSKQADVRLTIYDKQHERQCVGVLDALPCTRYELRLRRPGLTLRDVHEPCEVFWCHMAGALPRPAGVGPWEAFGTGFQLPRKDVPDPVDRFRMRMQCSSDLASLLALADTLPGGRALFLRELASAFPVVQPVAAASGGSGASTLH
jgi:hypothetical protein